MDILLSMHLVGIGWLEWLGQSGYFNGLFPNQIIKIGQHTKFQLKAFGSYPIMKVGYLRGCQVDWYIGRSGLNLPPGILKDN